MMILRLSLVHRGKEYHSSLVRRLKKQGDDTVPDTIRNWPQPQIGASDLATQLPHQLHDDEICNSKPGKSSCKPLFNTLHAASMTEMLSRRVLPIINLENVDNLMRENLFKYVSIEV